MRSKQVGVAALLALTVPLVAGGGGAQQTTQTTKVGKAKQATKTPTKAAVKAAPPSVAPVATAEIGKPFRDFALRDIASDEKATFKLSDLKGKKALVAVFMANRCGTTWTYEEKIGKLLEDYAGKDVQIVAIHSNYQEPDRELVEAMQQRNLAMPVLDDKKTQALADYVGAYSTPTFFIVDKEGVLRYKGAFDRYGDDKQPYLRPALDAILAGEPVKLASTRPFG